MNVHSSVSYITVPQEFIFITKFFV